MSVIERGSKTAHRCIFCGGPVALENDDVAAPCGHCGAMLRIISPEGLENFLIDSNLAQHEAVFILEREIKERGMPLIRRRGEAFQLHVPFYRVVGNVFDFQRRIIEQKRVNNDGVEYTTSNESQKSTIKKREMSFSAVDSSCCGIESLGIRTSVLNLLPLTKDRLEDRQFIKTEYDLEYALQRYEKMTGCISALSGEGALNRFSKALQPLLSMVYLPVWIINFSNASGQFYSVVDCASKRVTAINSGQMEPHEINYQTAIKEHKYKLTAHRCDYCGADLSDQKRGEMFLCTNCGRLYRAEQDRYIPETFNIPRGKFNSSELFPFWMFTLRNTADGDKFKQALNLESDTIFIPAFGISNLKRAARISLAISHEIDKLEFDSLENSDYNFHTASLSSSEAAQIVLPYLYAGKDYLANLNLDELWRLYLEYDQIQLVWLPFEEEGFYFNSLLTGQGFEKTVLT